MGESDEAFLCFYLFFYFLVFLLCFRHSRVFSTHLHKMRALLLAQFEEDALRELPPRAR